MASNMMDIYETWNLSLLLSNEHIKNVTKDPSPSQEPPCPPELQQSVIILKRILDGFKHDRFLWNLKLKLIGIKRTHKNVKIQLRQTQLILLFILFYKYHLLNHWLDLGVNFKTLGLFFIRTSKNGLSLKSSLVFGEFSIFACS